MSNVLMEIFIQQVVPIISTIVMGFLAYFLPKILKKLDEYLVDRLKLQKELLTEKQEETISNEVIKWIGFAEEYARKELKIYKRVVDPAEKAAIASNMVKRNTLLSQEEAQDRVLIELDRLRR